MSSATLADAQAELQVCGWPGQQGLDNNRLLVPPESSFHQFTAALSLVSMPSFHKWCLDDVLFPQSPVCLVHFGSLVKVPLQ